MSKKIGILVPTLSSGGAEKVAAQVSRYLNTRFEVIIYTFARNVSEYESASTIKELPGRIPILKVIQRIGYLRRERKLHKFYAFISFLDVPNILNLFSKRDDFCVLTVHNNKSIECKQSVKEWFIGILIRITYRFAGKIVCVSEGVAEDLVENFGIPENKVVVINNSIEVPSFSGVINGDKFRYETPVILNVGRNVDQKNQLTLIRAFSEMLKKYSSAKLEIVGKTGDLSILMEKELVRLNLSESIKLIPFTKDISSFYRRSAIFVLSSKYEGFGNVIIEAIINGCYVISTDCPFGPREILFPAQKKPLKKMEVLENGLGELIYSPYSGNREALADEYLIRELSRMIIKTIDEKRTPNLNMVNALVERFSSEVISKKWMDILEL